MTEEFLEILQKAAAEEAQAQRLYDEMRVLAPTAAYTENLLEIFKDERDHAVIIEDMIVKYTTGQTGTISEQTGGVA